MDLDVVVTDRDGKRVTDLKREDFTVRVGGKVVPIDYFARVEAGTIHAPDLSTASPDQVLAAYRQAEQAYLPRHFLVYLDVGHLASAGRKRARPLHSPRADRPWAHRAVRSPLAGAHGVDVEQRSAFRRALENRRVRAEDVPPRRGAPGSHRDRHGHGEKRP